jgi:epoxyqueuosine reductase
MAKTLERIRKTGLDTKALKEAALKLGFDACGVCEAVPPPHLKEYESWIAKQSHGSMRYLERHIPLKNDPQRLLRGARSVIAFSLNYNQPNPSRPGFPRIAKYALGRDYHKVLRSKLRRLTASIEGKYGKAQFRVCVDSAPIMERDYANLAGLGWFGKNTMLIDSKRGSWFFIGILLTTLRFQPDAPSVGSCGKCHKCVDACPTGAIVFEEERWQVDARRCVSYLTIEHKGAIDPNLAAKFGDWTFGCDICQEVCPFNSERESQPERSLATRETDFLTPRDWPSLRELSQIPQARWDVLTRGSAVRRAGHDGLRRNARINLARHR